MSREEKEVVENEVRREREKDPVLKMPSYKCYEEDFERLTGSERMAEKTKKKKVADMRRL